MKKRYDIACSDGARTFIGELFGPRPDSMKNAEEIMGLRVD
jgi:hypothetical protein